MRRIMCLVVLVLMAVTVSPVSADFYVIGGGGGVGTKITSLPYTIINPGFYFLTGNLSVNGGDAILVNADDVTIDLMGFSLTNTGDIGLTTGILMSGRTNVEIRNGIVRGFHRGIKDESSSSNNHRAINVRARNNNVGILFWGSNQLIKNCNVSNNQQGISMTSGLIINNIAANSAIVLTGPGSLLAEYRL